MNELTYLGKEEEISRLREFFQTGYQRLFSEDKKKTDHGFCVRILIYINIFPFHLLVTLKHALCVCVLSHSVMSNSLQLRGLQPTRPLCSWDSLGKNTGLGQTFPSPGHLPDSGIEPQSHALARLNFGCGVFFDCCCFFLIRETGAFLGDAVVKNPLGMQGTQVPCLLEN